MHAQSQMLDDAPHRAYRRLPVLRPASIALSLFLVAGLEALLVVYLAPVVRVFGLTTFELVRYVGTPAAMGRDEFLGVPLFPLVFGTIPPLGYGAVLLWLAGSLAAVVGLGRLRRVVVAPLRYLLVYNLLLLAASAFYLLFAGHLGYDAEEFSRLYLRSVVTIWLVTPVFMGLLSLTLPFSPLERVGLVGLTVVYDMIFSAVRYAVFVWLLRNLGAVVMANLYLFLGPLLDVIYFVGIFGVFVLSVAHRMERRPAYLA
jgi:hypothetical protein